MWIYLPGQAPFCPSVPAEVAWTSESASLFQAIARGCTSRGKQLAAKRWFAACRKAVWMRRLFTAICAASTADPSGDFSRWLSEVSHASPPPSPASGKVSETSAGCGPMPCASSGKSSQSTSSGRTFPVLSRETYLLPSSRMSLARWKSWVTRLRRACSRRRKLAARSAASGSLCWPSTRVTHGEYTRDRGQKGAERPSLEGLAALWPAVIVPNGGRLGRRTGRGRAGQIRHLEMLAFLWPAASALVAQDGEAPETWLARREELKEQKVNGNGAGMPLAMASVLFPPLWAAAKASDGRGAGEHGEGGSDLRTQVGLWPATQSTDYKGEGNPPGRVRDGKPRTSGDDNLPTRAAAWPPLWAIPSARDWKWGEASAETMAGNARPLNEQVATRPPLWAAVRVTDGEKGGPAQSFSAGGTPLPTQALAFPSSLPDQPTSMPGQLYSPEHRGLLLRYRRWLYGVLGCKWMEKETEEETLKANSVRLSPYFVCLLMGWPLGCVLSGCSAMELSHWLLPMRSALLRLLSATPRETQGTLF